MELAVSIAVGVIWSLGAANVLRPLVIPAVYRLACEARALARLLAGRRRPD